MITATETIQKAIDKVAARIAIIPEANVQRLEQNAQLDSLLEAIAYQDLQARSHASGKILLGVALWLYNILGGEIPCPESFGRNTLPERIVAMELLACLMRIK